MTTLYVDRKNIHIKLDSNALAFYVNGEKEGTAPIHSLKRVIIVGNATIETNVLHKLAEENVSVVFLTGKNLKFAGMLHGELHNNALVRIKQYENNNPIFQLTFSKKLVIEKINNQINLINYLKEEKNNLREDAIKAISALQEIQNKVENEKIDIEKLRGYEGGASAVFFSFYTKTFPESLGFTHRNRRPPKDPVNAMLSLCYTILHYECVREIEMIGLDPCIGFYHAFEYGRESLACDFVEKYRYSAEKFVWETFRTRKIIGNDFIMEENSGCYLKKSGRAKFYPLAEEWRKEIRPKIRDDITNFARSLTNEKDIIYT